MGITASLTLASTAPGLHHHGRDHINWRRMPDTAVAVSAARKCTDIVNGLQRLRVRMLPNGVEEATLAIARAEVDAIWRPYQIEIVWEREEVEWLDRDLLVQFVDWHLPAPNARAIAWIPFLDGVPTSIIRVSRPAATALLKTKSFSDWPPVYIGPPNLQRQALGRIIGRALAHEIGHFLLAVPRHAKRGLMRASFDPRQLVHPGTQRYRLMESDVRALRSARIASCEVIERRQLAQMQVPSRR
ncbi:MAG: hypothetical protein ACRD2X_10635 [Vicinamibacteraceae bacterium]